MSLVVYEWDSTQKISCSDCLPADVILCVAPGIVAQSLCPIQPVLVPETTASDDFPYATILAQLINYSEQLRHGRHFYRYAFRFDDAQLVPGTVITSSTIQGVICEGCLTAWVREQTGNEIKLEKIPGDPLHPDRYRLTSQHGCEFEFNLAAVQVSNDGGNALHLGTDGGLYVTEGGVPAIVSSDLGNIVDIGTDGGALLTCPDVASCISVVSDGAPALVSNPSPGSFGVGVKVSANAGNGIVVAGDGGLWAPNAAAIGTDSVVIDPGGATSGGDLVIHEALDGTVVDFAAGIDTILKSLPGDPAFGVGAGYMLQNFDLSGQQLLIRAASEHTAVAVQKNSDLAFGGPYSIDPATTYTRGIFNAPLSFTNPSSVRSMLCLIFYKLNASILLGPSITCERRSEINLNGGGWSVNMNRNMGIALTAGRLNRTESDIQFIIQTLPPGGILTLDLRMTIATTIAGTGGNSWEGLSGTAIVAGITV